MELPSGSEDEGFSRHRHVFPAIQAECYAALPSNIMILDTGCSLSLVSEHAAKEVANEIWTNSQGRFRVEFCQAKNPVTFNGIGGTQTSFMEAKIPIQFGNCIIYAICHVTPGKHPV